MIKLWKQLQMNSLRLDITLCKLNVELASYFTGSVPWVISGHIRSDNDIMGETSYVEIIVGTILNQTRRAWWRCMLRRTLGEAMWRPTEAFRGTGREPDPRPGLTSCLLQWCVSATTSPDLTRTEVGAAV